MPSGPRSDALIAEIQREFPRFRLVAKSDRRLQRAIDVALKVVTLGAQREYLTRYHTVLGDTVYLPTKWADETDEERFVILRHERVHLRQRRRHGSLIFAAIYLFPILPLGLAWGRARIEWEAYAETLRAVAEVKGIGAARDPALHAYLVEQFASGAYGWMWPFPSVIRRWIAEALEQIAREVA